MIVEKGVVALCGEHALQARLAAGGDRKQILEIFTPVVDQGRSRISERIGSSR